MRLRIIVVDDEQVIRDVLEDFLTALGHEVLTSTEPTSCPIYTAGECPCGPGEVCGDFLITDNRMPRISGIQFIQNQNRAGCKGIAGNKAIMSASFTEEELEEVKKLKCRIFRKPFSLAEIEEWVNENKNNIDPARRLRDL